MSPATILATVGWMVAAVVALAYLRVRRTVREKAPPAEVDAGHDERDLLRTDVSRLRVTLDGLDQAVFLFDVNGELVLRNIRAQSPTGTHHGDALVREAVERQVVAAVNHRVGTEQVALLDPTRRVFHVGALSIEQAPGGVVATVTDMTDRARLDAVRTDFVANISHELKTPVGAMTVLAETLAEEDDPDVTRRLAGKVLRESLRLGEMVDDLLELSRIELGEDLLAEEVKVSAVVAEAIDRGGLGAARRQVVIETDAAGVNGLTMRADRRQLVSAVANLVDNAVKYSDDHGHVVVKARRVGDDVLISVGDRGMGIAARHAERIFERFYRVDKARSRQTGGTGLGLAIVRHVAINHGGDISVQSEEGVGSTFTLRLPIERTS